MGGDAQPQIIVQLLARLLRAGQDPATAVAAPRLALDAPSAGPFRLWWGDDLTVLVESDAPPRGGPGLDERGHRVRPSGPSTPPPSAAPRSSWWHEDGRRVRTSQRRRTRAAPRARAIGR